MHSNTQVLRHYRTATRTHLRRSAWVNKHHCSASICRFARTSLCKLMPRHVTDASVHATVIAVLHLLYVKFLKDQKLITIDQFTGSLMGKIIPAVGNPSVNMLHHTLVFSTCRSALHVLTESLLCIGKGNLVTFEEPWVLNTATVRHGGKMRDAKVNSSYLVSGWQWVRFDNARETHVPLANGIPTYRKGLGFSNQRTVQFDLHITDLGQSNRLVINKRPVALLLWIGERVVSIFPTEPRIAWFLACFDTTEERTECQINTFLSILHGLSVSLLQPGFLLLPDGRHLLCVIPTEAAFVVLPGIPADFDGLVVHPSAAVELGLQEGSLCFSRVYSILERFPHSKYNLHRSFGSVKQVAIPTK